MVHASTRASDFSNRDLSVGDVLTKSFGVLSRHVISFSLLNLLMIVPAALIVVATVFFALKNGGDLNNPSPETTVAIVIGALAAVVWVFLSFPAIFGAIVHVSFQDMRGKKGRIGEGFKLGLSRLLPMFGMSLIIGFGLAFAVLLLLAISVALGLIGAIISSLMIIPGIILMLMWYVAFPVCLVETAGPIASLKRSRELTSGHKWALFGIVVIVLIGSFAIPLVPQILLMQFPAVQGLVVLLIQLLLSAYSTVLLVVVYHELRVAKEGVDIEGIASVFD